MKLYSTRTVYLLLPFLVAAVAAGCGGAEQIETAPPEGWQADGAHWWTPGTDTAKAFRDLSSVEAMGVTQGSPVYSASQSLTDEQVTMAAKQGLEKLYRKAPETVDSLFAEYVAPQVAELPRTGDMQAQVEAFSKKSHDLLTENYFRPPAKQLRLGEDIPVGYPDSLFEQGTGGRVHMQVYVNAEGQPQAIELLDGTHPVLNDTARRAVAQMRWQPARVRQGTYGWRPIPSWTWVNVSFGQA